MKFHGLTASEVEQVKEMIAARRCAYEVDGASAIKARFYVQYPATGDGDPNFTIAVLEVTAPRRKKPVQLVGVAKRDPNSDEMDTRRGRKIALARALKGMCDELEV